DAHLRPPLANLGDDASQFFDRTGRTVDIGWPQLGGQQVTPAKDIERQIAVTVVVAMKEPTLLLAVHWVVGGIQIDRDLAWVALVRLWEYIDKQLADGHRIVTDLMVARRLQHAALQTIQRRLAGYRRTILTPSLQFAGKNPHHRIVAQVVVVDQILVAKRDAEHTLSHQRRNLMLDQLLTPCVIEASRKPRHQSDRSIRLSQQQRSSIGGD